MLDLEGIKKILNSDSGQALKDYLVEKLDELKSIENVADIIGTEEQALEVKAQKRAHQKLKEILLDIDTWEVDNKPKDPRDNFDVQP